MGVRLSNGWLGRDGLVRVAFTRKNKTLGAIFRQSRTLQLLEANHAVVQVRVQPPLQESRGVVGAANGQVA